MKNVLLVARRELQANMARKSFVAVTVIMLVVIVAGIFVMNYFITRDSDDGAVYDIAISESAAELSDDLSVAGSTMFGLDVVPREIADTAAAEAGLRNGEFDAFVSGEPGAPVLTFESEPDQQLIQIVTSAVQVHAMNAEVTALGGDPAQFMSAISDASPTVEFLAASENGDFGPQYFISMVMLALLMFGLMNAGSIISMGVVEEKSSRVVEILLSTIKPSQLFAGKVLGAGAVGLFQLVLYGVGIFAATTISGLFEGFEIPVGSYMLAMAGWFLVGFLTIGTLWGALSSLVSRQEDVGAITGPMIFVVLIPFYVAMFLVPNDPDGSVTTALSMTPILSPFIMPVRMAFTDVEMWQMLVAVGANLVLVPIIMWVAGRIYRRGVLHTGSRMKLSEAFGRAK